MFLLWLPNLKNEREEEEEEDDDDEVYDFVYVDLFLSFGIKRERFKQFLCEEEDLSIAKQNSMIQELIWIILLFSYSISSSLLSFLSLFRYFNQLISSF